MKPNAPTLLILLFLATGPSSAATPTSTPTSTPATSAEPAPSARVLTMADRCTDFTTNGWGFKSPRNFLHWLDIFSTPDIHLEFARRALDPLQTVRALNSLLDPGTPRNYLEWTHPELYEGWMRALPEPEFQQAVLGIVGDADRLARWIALPADPRPWRLLADAFSVNTVNAWLTAPTNPATQALFARASDPATFENWVRELADPDNYATPALPR